MNRQPNASIRRIDYSGSRVETGPLQLGEDWPGTFIRGDDSFALRTQMLGLLAELDGNQLGASATIAASSLARFCNLLDACNLNKNHDSA